VVGEKADRAPALASVRRLRPHLTLPASRPHGSSPRLAGDGRSLGMTARMIAAAVIVLAVTAIGLIGYLHNPAPRMFALAFTWGHSPIEIARVMAVSLAFVASGFIVWRRHPATRIGPLMIAVGGALPLEGFQYLPIPALVSVGMWFGNGLAILLLSFLVLVYPTGRITSRLQLAWASLAAGHVLILQLAVALHTPRPLGANCAPACRPLVVLAYNEHLSADLWVLAARSFGVLSLLLLGLIVHRWILATRPMRRAMAPIWVAGGAIALIAVSIELFWEAWTNFPAVVPSLSPLTQAMEAYLPWVITLSLLLVPVALLWGLLRVRLGQSAVSALAIELGRSGPRRPLVESLRRALRDPSLDLAFWSRPAAGYVNLEGEPVSLPGDENVRALTRLDGEDGPLAALIHDPALAEQRPLVDGVAAVARLSIENERLHAEVRAQLEDVRASRERIVRAADHERRRVERNIHDGAQQRLVSLSLALSMAQAKVNNSSPEVAATLVNAEAELKTAIRELRELARGIHPAILTEAGLAAALDSLVEQSPVPVRLHTELNGRLASSVEATVYFVAAEALTNVAKYAAATSVQLSVSVVDGWLRLIVADDGVGGADPDQGSGLRGLLDRVAALGGRLSIDSVPGGGTRLTAEMPCG
jgi:signal transduction histidine kinase